jgi:hypothetical protein
MTTNKYEAAARTLKASRLAAAMRSHVLAVDAFLDGPGVETSAQDVADVARQATPAMWGDVADLAGLRRPSDATIESAVALLAGEAAADAPTLLARVTPR